MSDILVTVVVPTKNGSKYISRAIQSVQNQDFKFWELIAVNDGSTDTTAAVLESHAVHDSRIRMLTNFTSLGVPVTLNKGIAQARGAYIARIDDDDEWCDPHKLSQQVEFFQEHPEHVLVGTGVIVQDEHRRELWRYCNPETDADIRPRLLGKNCFSNATVMFRKAAWERAGGYSSGARLVEDYEFWLRLGTMGMMANLPIYSTRYTIRSGNTTALHHRKAYWLTMGVAYSHRHSYPNYVWGQLRNFVRLMRYWFKPKLTV